MVLPPNATDITVREVLAKLDAEFEPFARAVQNGEFALWVGAGISRRAPSLGDILTRAVEIVRERAADPATAAIYRPALIAILALAEIDEAVMIAQLVQPFNLWPNKDAIVERLWNKYARVLDVRIAGQPSDFMLWDVIDIRTAFAHPAPPAAQHLCIAILILEGAIHEIASANWDGFIEAAVSRLAGGAPGLLQAVVDPNHLRQAAGCARLLKFHGCITHAADDPLIFRRYLVGSHTQITNWPLNPDFAAIRTEVTSLATNLKSLVLGLSIQDANLQGVFAAAKQLHPWPWPCAPHAPGHVFCEDALRDGQRDVLKIVYGEAYNDNIEAIEAAAHLRSWAEQVLIGLVLKLLCDKLKTLIGLRLAPTALGASATALAAPVQAVFRQVAGLAEGNRTALMNQGIALWSRLLALFRTGALPADPDAYQSLTTSTPSQLAADANAQAAGLGDLALAIGLLEDGRSAGLWTILPPADSALTSGALTALALWAGADPRPVFLVRGAAEAITLERSGAFANDNAIVIHSDDVWQHLKSSGKSARRSGAAPGRRGRVTTRHISISSLVDASAGAADLSAGFIAEVTL